MIPDTKELDKELKKKRTFSGLLGFGGGEKDKTKKQKTSSGILAGIIKGTVLLAVITTILSSLADFLKPIFSLFKVILSILFLPLIPLLKPVLKGLGELARRLVPIMIELSEKVEKIVTPRLAEIIDAIIDFVVTRVDAFVSIVETVLDIFENFAPFLDVVLNSIISVLNFFNEKGLEFFQNILDALLFAADFLVDKWGTIKDILTWIGTFFEPAWKIIKDALEEAGDFLQERWDSILSILERTADLLESVFDKISNIFSGKNLKRLSPIPLPFLGPFATGGVIPETGLALVHKGETVVPAGRGMGITQNITIQATINNDLDIRRLAERLAELSKDELARSTGSQRF